MDQNRINENYLSENSSNEPQGAPTDDEPAKKDYLSKAKICFKIAKTIIVISLVIFIILLIKSGGSFDESGAGAVWWFLIFLAPLFYALPVILLVGLIFTMLHTMNKKKHPK